MVTGLDRVVLSFENGGARIGLHPYDPTGGYVRGAGADGLGVAPTSMQIDASVTGGGRWRWTRRASRQVTVPVLTFGADRGQVESRLRALVRLLQDDVSTPRLVASYPDGTEFDAECHYAGGGDHQWGTADTDGRTYCRWVVQVVCPDAYFTARTPTVATVRSTGRGLLRPGGSFSQLRLTSTQTAGAVTVRNGGDAPAWPTWTVTGPGASFIAMRRSDGATLAYVGTTARGLIVDARARTARDGGGANLYGRLLGAPQFFTLPAGESVVDVAVDGSDPSTVVGLSFSERREVVF